MQESFRGEGFLDLFQFKIIITIITIIFFYLCRRCINARIVVPFLQLFDRHSFEIITDRVTFLPIFDDLWQKEKQERKILFFITYNISIQKVDHLQQFKLEI